MQVSDSNKRKRTILILSIVLLFLQLVLSPNLVLFDGHINFALIFCALIALGMNGPLVIVSGFVAGFIYDLLTTGPIGLMALELTICAFLLSQRDADLISDDSKACFKLFSFASISVEVIYHLIMLFNTGVSSLIHLIFLNILASSVLDIVFFVPLLLILSHLGATKSSLGSSSSRDKMRVKRSIKSGNLKGI